MYTKVQAKFEVILAPHLTKICFSYLNNLLKPIVVDYTGHLTHSYEDLHTMKYLIENLYIYKNTEFKHLNLIIFQALG